MNRFIFLLLMLPIVQNVEITKRRRLNTSILYEPIDAMGITFDFPKLTDVLPTLVQKTSFDYDNIPGVTIKNLSIDIDKINIDKFKKKIKSIAENIAKNEPNLNPSRRQAILGTQGHSKSEIFRQKRKALDLMLQTLYMARHKVKSLEGSKYFNNKDTGYRIAFIYRRLGRIFRKMMRIFTYQARNRDAYTEPNSEIILHGKVTRLHVDFVYLFWVLIKLDRKHKEIMKAREAYQAEIDKYVLAQNKMSGKNAHDNKSRPLGMHQGR